MTKPSTFFLLATLVACSSSNRAPEPSSQPEPVAQPAAPAAPAAPAVDPAVALARDILTSDGVGCSRNGRVCVTTMLERDGEGGSRKSYQLLWPGTVQRTTVVYDFIATFPDDEDAAIAGAVDAAVPALAALIREEGLVAVPNVAADDQRSTSEVPIAYGTLALGERDSLVDLIGADGKRRSVLPIDPLGSYSFMAAAQPPGTPMALLRVHYTPRAVDNPPTLEVAHLVNLGRESMLLGVLVDGDVACSAVPARCIARRDRRGDGGGYELAYQILTPGKTVVDEPFCDGDLADCDEPQEESAAIARTVAALRAAPIPGDVAELATLPAVDDSVTLAAGTLAIRSSTLRLGTRTLDRLPAGTRLLSAAAPLASPWLVAKLEIPPDQGRAGQVVVTRMYSTK